MKKPGGFRRCRVILADHPELYPLNNICAWLHHETTGLWPNEGCHHPTMKNCRRKLKRVVGGSLWSDGEFDNRIRKLVSRTGKKRLTIQRRNRLRPAVRSGYNRRRLGSCLESHGRFRKDGAGFRGIRLRRQQLGDVRFGCLRLRQNLAVHPRKEWCEPFFRRWPYRERTSTPCLFSCPSINKKPLTLNAAK